MAVAGGAADVGIQGNFRTPSAQRRLALSRLALAVSDLKSGVSSFRRVTATKEIRQILNSHLDWISPTKLTKTVSLLKRILLKKAEPEVYENVLWTLCNLSCESQSMAHLVKKGEINIIQKISEFILDKSPQSVKDQAIWTLSNFAADCDVCRSEVRSTKILMKICQMLKEVGNEEKRKSLIIWAIRNYVRPVKTKTSPLFESPEEFDFFSDTIVDELKLQMSNEIVIEGLNAFLEVIYSESSLIPKIGMEDKIIDVILDFLEYPDEVASVVVEIVGRLSEGPDSIVQKFIDKKIINIFLHQIPIFKNNIKKLIFWTFSNMTSTFNKNITLLFRNNEIFMDLVFNHCYDPEQDIQIESIMCLMNILLVLDDEDYHQLLLNNVGRIFVDVLLKNPINETRRLRETVYCICLHILEKLKYGDKSIMKAALELNWSGVFLHRFYNTIPFISPNSRDISFKVAAVCQDIIEYICYGSVSH